MKKRILIWGTGNRTKDVLKVIGACEILAFVETKPSSAQFQGIVVIPPEGIKDIEFDILLVPIVDNCQIEKYINDDACIKKDKVVFLSVDNLLETGFYYNQYKLIRDLIPLEYLRQYLSWNFEFMKYSPQILVKEHMDEERKHLILYAEQRGYLQFLNYEFTEKYVHCKYDIQYDGQKKMYYAVWKERKFFFPRSWKLKQAACYWRDAIMCYDEKSPLATSMQNITQGGIAVEITQEMPLWSINEIDNVACVYIVNSDKEWAEAIKASFEDQGKEFYVINSLSECKEERIDKMRCDISENVAQWLSTYLGKFFILNIEVYVYYKKDDLKEVQGVLESKGFQCRESDGYVYYPQDVKPFEKIDFRKGIVIGTRQEEKNTDMESEDVYKNEGVGGCQL